ncbi:CCA tRNA nucleotidyltransferase [Staphylococcus pettenkoferi]|uniref:CCA-adding enzyme n=1 Tax=Staphylococcus pettenkoferi TaxID=170573 RepID=A0A9Q4D4D1_9STAP|nr:CCA tRNA nucleotidyltransferase [Staphylococcus pettenkoferi]MCY1570002.1 CCA tRNA nucleotidyltransferase [Staphylococcus pettenkoferi]MCY1576312.1 CCA tRNA nucleotidyltransferase [Staphylococcus pettenkoferi]MCY1594098.1 CCA tRNA nucleotidyltransferase [Staphylococcus pettenkoferi]MCY1616888.1 CCA tRNA nucleotidyltransferase [Staphylococcus pettenkoferi]
MTNTLFEQAKPLLEQLEHHGYQAYYVGGCVRDYIMERPIHDIDITTSATPDEVEALFEKTIPVGKEHGTINVVDQGENYEITTFRAEAEYTDHRRPSEVYFVRELYEDVKRRDFTMNALAMDTDYQLHDYFNGRADIHHKLIRTVGEAQERFDEDALRILRGLRFQAQLGFDIEQATYTAMKANCSSLEYLSVERVVVELRKLLSGDEAPRSYRNMADMEAFNYLPYFNHYDMNKMQVVEPLAFTTFLAILNVQQPLEMPLAHLKISNDEKKEVAKLTAMIQALPSLTTKKQLRTYIYDYGAKEAKMCFLLQESLIANDIAAASPLIFNMQTIEEIAQQLPIRQRNELDVTGKDLMSHTGLKGGKWVKHALRELELAVVNEQVINQQKALLEWMDQHVEIQ